MGESMVPPWRSDSPTIRWGAYAWALVGFGLAFVLAWRALGYVRVVVAPFTVAVFLAAILTPPARWLEGRGAPPALAAFAVLVAFVLVIGSIATVITLNIQTQIDSITQQIQSSYRQIAPQINELPFIPTADELFGEITGPEGQATESEGSSNGASGDGASDDGTGDGASSGAQGGEGGSGGGISSGAQDAAVAAITGLGRFLTEFFLFLVATFFYVKDRRQIARWLAHLFPADRREYAVGILQRTWSTVGGYIRGQAIIATIDGAFVGIGLFIAGIPLAAALGVLVFLGAFVPVVGSIVAGAAAVGIGLATKGLAGGLIALAIVIGVQQLEGNLLAPVILGRTVEIHPLAVLAAVTAGAVLLGVWGAVIGVPLAASLYRAGTYLREEEAIDGVEPEE